ncbi:MAG: DUF5667 domain-containing protein [Candidatus Methanoperedens sp.]|nr:DUF5667 domain-containing protein [Candidatus Methanoperedens sp.]
MNMRNTTLAAIILLALAFTISVTGAAQENQTSNATEDLVDDIEEYDGSIGPGNALYGLKIAFENIDETFTFNASEKLGKQVAHARKRIAEAKAELRKNNSEAADRALLQYREKSNSTEGAISGFSGSDSGLLRSQEMIAKHQYVLERLLESHPNNTGLQRAYNNSQRLEEKFENKTERKLERIATKEGRKILKQVKKEKKEDRDEIDEGVKIRAKIIGNDTQVEVRVKFVSDSAGNFTIAQEILDRLQFSKENITRLLKIEEESEGELKERLEAEAEIKMNVSKVEAEYQFPLSNVTNRTDIIDRVYNKLSSLTAADILQVLEIKVKTKTERQEIREERKEERRENIGEVRETRRGNRT